jgi:putative tryptophan/tyrosine transport system substrate-binding protein
VAALLSGLRELGYIDGTTIHLEFRWADGKYDLLPQLAAEYERLQVDVLVTHGTPGTLAAKAALKTIPIVAAAIGDPVTTGVVTSIAHPGGNITGLAHFSPELAVKRLEILTQAFPLVKRVAIVFNPDQSSRRAYPSRYGACSGIAPGEFVPRACARAVCVH